MISFLCVYQSAIDKCNIKTKQKRSPLTSNHITGNESRYTALSVVSRSIKTLSQLILSIFIYYKYFFNRFCLVKKCGVNPHCLYRDISTLICDEKLRKNFEWYYDNCLSETSLAWFCFYRNKHDRSNSIHIA